MNKKFPTARFFQIWLVLVLIGALLLRNTVEGDVIQLIGVGFLIAGIIRVIRDRKKKAIMPGSSPSN